MNVALDQSLNKDVPTVDQVNPTVAILMTCFNQVDQVLRCLKSIYDSKSVDIATFKIYLVDDGSSDETARAVIKVYPDVKVIAGSGSLFWNQGMRLAYGEAIREDFDFHLWLNSDAILYHDTLDKLLKISLATAGTGPPAIVTGAMVDEETGELTSGGFSFKGPRLFMALELLPPPNCSVLCETVSGNCVLIPRVIYSSLGNICEDYQHSLGDIDYGLRARRAGYRVILAPGLYGTSPTLRPRRVPRTFLEAVKLLRDPLGIVMDTVPPKYFVRSADWRKFLRTHAGLLWWVPWLLTQAKLATIIHRRAGAQLPHANIS